MEREADIHEQARSVLKTNQGICHILNGVLLRIIVCCFVERQIVNVRAIPQSVRHVS